MINTATKENILRVFPEVLARSDKIQALGDVMAEFLAGGIEDAKKCSIYAQIDTLPEAVLDVLAYDFKVDWYYSTYALAIKREIIKNCIAVHKTQGTRGGCINALKAIFGDVAIEEWQESNGRPYHYGVGIPAVGIDTIDADTINKMLACFVPCRCILEDGAPAVFTGVTVLVGVNTGYTIYTTPVCGTIPYRSTYGRIDVASVQIALDGDAAEYTTPMTGQINAGTWPDVSTKGETGTTSAALGDDGAAYAYSLKACGSAKTL